MYERLRTVSELLVGWRKTGYWMMSVLCLTVGAAKLNATFVEYRDGLIVLAGLVLGVHAYQQIKQPPEKAAGGPR